MLWEKGGGNANLNNLYNYFTNLIDYLLFT